MNIHGQNIHRYKTKNYSLYTCRYEFLLNIIFVLESLVALTVHGTNIILNHMEDKVTGENKNKRHKTNYNTKTI